MADYSAFWDAFLKKAGNIIPLYQGVNPTIKQREKSWLHTKKGSFEKFCTVCNPKKAPLAHVEICFQSEKAESKSKYDPLFKIRADIEKKFGEELIWEDNPKIARCKIMSKPIEFHFNDQTTWDSTIDSLLEKMSRFIQAIEQTHSGNFLTTSVAHPPNLLGEHYLPSKQNVESAKKLLGSYRVDIDTILDQLERVVLSGKRLHPDWRKITEEKLEIWFK